MRRSIIYSICAATLLLSCSKDFLDNPSPNNPTADTYYQTAEEVRGGTGLLYNTIWYEWQDKAFHAIGEVLSGNMYTGDPKYSTFYNFTVSGTDEQVTRSWYAFYKVAGNSTVLINTFEQKLAGAADPSFLVQGIAEARFMRGAAYFYLARVFKDVPIVSDPVALASSGNYNVPKYQHQDVLRFALEDFMYAEENLKETDDPGRVTKFSAKGMMAKIYLYMKDYEKARTKALEVINSNKYDLYPNYMEMFTKSSANNNIESLFALQWEAAGGYAVGNPIQAYTGPTPLLRPTTGAGWSAIIPSIDILRAYESGDKRRQWSVMEHGFTNASWANVNFPSGYTYDTTWSNSNDDPFKIKTPTRSNALKYTVGPGGNGEEVNGTSSDINTYILRYADVLLIYAEAVLGDAASTADAGALNAFNKVRRRAGFTTDKTSITKADILKERRVEFAFEGDYWFDIQRQGFTAAKQIIEAQERGTYNFNGEVDQYRVSLSSEKQLFLPIPTTEIAANPELDESKPAVPYY